MDVRIKPSPLRGEIGSIPSKSYAQRILIAAALSEGETKIYLGESSRDIEAAITAIKGLGADITRDGGIIKVRRGAAVENPVVHCGESGTAARILLPLLAALHRSATLTGEGSLTSRPFKTLCGAMAENGCNFSGVSLPISFSSGLRPGKYFISGGESSQYISGLMFALPLLRGDSEIVLTSPLESSGYIDITLEVLKNFGVESGYSIRGEQGYISPKEIAVEGDWSNAAFWLAAGVKVTGLNPRSLQRDRLFTELKDREEIDASQIPDLVPVLAVCAAGKNSRTRIYNAGRLRIKESDRLETVCRMLSALGGDIVIHGDSLIINGRGRLSGGRVDSFGDHRIVMSAAIASCICDSEVLITNAQAAEKSYPGFFRDFNTLGGEADVLRHGE